MLSKFLHVLKTAFLLSGILFSSFQAQNTVLIDFGSTEAGNMYGLSGWDNLLLSDRMAYTNAGPGGVVLESEFEEYSDFMGVAGTVRDFNLGERIVVTWYNNSGETIVFTSRISFEDEDQPDGGDATGNWFTMRSFSDYGSSLTEILPRESAKTVFNITGSGVHKSDESYTIVNINLAIEWGQSNYKQYLVCDKIELFDDADITAPGVPANVIAESVSDSKVRLHWDRPEDNTGVVEYLVYLNGEVEGYSRTESYEAVFLEQSKDYSLTVTALDMFGNESSHSAVVNVSTLSFSHSNFLINPTGFNYMGAFRIPEEFDYGGEAIAYRATGDGGQSGAGAADGFPGSMFVTNLNQAHAGLVGEVSIPEPVISAGKNITELNDAVILQAPVNIRPDNINSWDYVDIWRTGLQFNEAQERLYSSWTIHYTVGGEKNATISAADAGDLAGSLKHGAWYLGPQSESPIDAMANDYLFSVPPLWFPTNIIGSALVTGRFRDGGLSGLGPTLYAFDRLPPSLPPANTELEIIPILEYGPVSESNGFNFPNSIDGYNHSDSWREAVWVSAEDQNAIAFIGNKALGNHWYGYTGEEMRNSWVFADVPYPDFYETDPDGKGWRAHHYIPMIIFYSMYDLGDASRGNIELYEPQPYAALRIDRDIFWGGHQEIVSAGYDSHSGILYVAELYSGEYGTILIHAWSVDKVVSVQSEASLPGSFRLEQNYPNPFNPTTTIKYSLPSVKRKASFANDDDIGVSQSGDWLYNVTLKVYNILGKEVTTLVNSKHSPGNYEVRWDASGFSSGVYFYRLSAGNFSQTRKMILLR